MRCAAWSELFSALLWGCLGLAASLFVGCGSQATPEARSTSSPRAVRIQVLTTQPLDRTITVLGSLRPYQEAVLSAKVDGRLEIINVDIGSEVKAGQVLAQVETRDYELKLRQAEAALAQARARLGLDPKGTNDVVELADTTVVREAQAVFDEAKAARERQFRLTEARVSSSSELETAEAAYLVAMNRYEAARDEVRQRLATLQQRRAELEIAHQELNDTRLIAPFDGLVQARRASPGHFLSPGDPVVTLVQVRPLRLHMEVPEVQASRIGPDQEVRFTLTGSTNIYTAKLVRISPALESASRMLIVEADVPNDGSLHAGAFADSQIVVERGVSVLAVPIESLLVFAGIEKVLVEEEGKVSEKDVETGTRNGGWVEIKSGLKLGDRVILDPAGLRSGQPITTQETS